MSKPVFQEKVISESRNKKLIPTLSIVDKTSKTLRSYNLPVGAHLIVNEGEQIDEGKYCKNTKKVS